MPSVIVGELSFHALLWLNYSLRQANTRKLRRVWSYGVVVRPQRIRRAFIEALNLNW
jgi:L-lysine 2,3-aminomutase